MEMRPTVATGGVRGGDWAGPDSVLNSTKQRPNTPVWGQGEREHIFVPGTKLCTAYISPHKAPQVYAMAMSHFTEKESEFKVIYSKLPGQEKSQAKIYIKVIFFSTLAWEEINKCVNHFISFVKST